MLRRTLHRALCASTLLLALAAHALTLDEARAIASGESEARITALNKAVATADDKTAAFIKAMADDAVKYTEDKVFLIKDDKAYDPVTGAELKLPDNAEDVVNNNLMRGALDAAQAALKLTSKDDAVRAEAAQALFKEPDESRLPLVEKALAAETNDRIKAQLELVRAASMLSSADKARRLAAAKALGESRSPDTKLLLNQRLADETDADVRRAIGASIDSIDGSLVWGDRINAIFSGISLGSVLLLAALGLAITYADGRDQHGARRADDDRRLCHLRDAGHLPALHARVALRLVPGRRHSRRLPRLGAGGRGAGARRDPLPLRPAARDPAGHLGHQPDAAAAGALALRRAERRCRESRLDERRLHHAEQRHAALEPHLHHRLRSPGAAGHGWLIGRTRLGLFVRGVTQNRPIASCMGVNTARIDTYAFALGSGIAGLAGCALSQIGNVGPDLGQSYIVDSFMVVVMGGVGQLAGTVYAALGLGVLNKFIEGWAGAVLAKIAVLVFIIIFIQKRPQGIFAVKGRSAEA